MRLRSAVLAAVLTLPSVLLATEPAPTTPLPNTMAAERAWPDVAIPPGEVLAKELEARARAVSARAAQFIFSVTCFAYGMMISALRGSTLVCTFRLNLKRFLPFQGEH